MTDSDIVADPEGIYVAIEEALLDAWDQGEIGDERRDIWLEELRPQPGEAEDAYRQRVIEQTKRLIEAWSPCSTYVEFLERYMLPTDAKMANALFWQYYDHYVEAQRRIAKEQRRRYEQRYSVEETDRLVRYIDPTGVQPAQFLIADFEGDFGPRVVAR